MNEFKEMLKKFPSVRITNAGRSYSMPKIDRESWDIIHIHKPLEFEEFRKKGKTPDAAKYRLLAAIDEYLADEDIVEVVIREFPYISEDFDIAIPYNKYYRGYARLLKITKGMINL